MKNNTQQVSLSMSKNRGRWANPAVLTATGTTMIGAGLSNQDLWMLLVFFVLGWILIFQAIGLAIQASVLWAVDYMRNSES